MSHDGLLVEHNNSTPIKPLIQLKYKTRRKNKLFASAIPIELRPDQVEHKERLMSILDKSPFAFDFYMLGTGKTYTSSSIFNERGFQNLVAIVPTSVKAKWRYMEEHHGVEQFARISYCELRCVKLKQPRHKFLVRKDFTSTLNRSDGTSQEIEQCTFSCTNFYLNLVKEGLLLVIDEIQNVKNISDQLLACKELIRPIIESFKEGGKSRVLLLSGSPIDKQVQVIHLYRCLGIMKSDQLRSYNPFTGETIDRGIEEIRNYLSTNFRARYREYNTNNQYDSYYLNPKLKELEKRCYKWFQQIVKPELSSAMPPVRTLARITKNNAFYKMEKRDLGLLHTGIDVLKKATNYNAWRQTVSHGHNGVDNLRSIQRALIMIETSKINLLVRVAAEHLALYPKSKVVICVNYIATLDDLCEMLDMYNPLKLSGNVSSSKRYEILKKFQEPSLEHRLLIGNSQVCCTGIDLDDQNGEYPRLCLVNPNYNAISLYQLSHRFHRSSTKSDSTVHFVFGKSHNTELPILNALSKKGEVMRETTEEQSRFGIIFPGDYETWEEN